MQIWNMGKDVVGQNQIGALALIGEFPGGLLAEEFCPSGNTTFLGYSRDIGGRLDSQARNAVFDKIAQQVSVVTGHFDDETLTVQTESPDLRFRILLCVGKVTGGERRKICVFAENVLPTYVCRQLHEQTLIAYVNGERI